MQIILPTLLCAVALGGEGGAVKRTDHFVQSHPGIRIYIRNVVDIGNTRGLPVLLVHGGSPPGEVVFDLGVAGYSLAEAAEQDGKRRNGILNQKRWAEDSVATPTI